MKAMAIGLVTAVSSYEKDGVRVHNVSVGLGRQAFNVGVSNPDDYYVGDSVCLIGEFGVGKTGMYCMDAHLHLSSAAERMLLGVDVRQRPPVGVDHYTANAEVVDLIA